MVSFNTVTTGDVDEGGGDISQPEFFELKSGTNGDKERRGRSSRLSSSRGDP